jgi:acyl-CoA synthetase (AMP-forming)/AMP-acid ligase II
MEFQLADLSESVADAVHEREAIACAEKRVTHAELDEQATRLAHALSRAGVRPGDHIGLYLYNGIEYIEGMLAAFKIRAVPVNINFRYVEDELYYLFDNADLVGIIHHREFGPRIAAIAGRLPKLTTFFAVEDGSDADCSAIGSLNHDEELANASPERDFAPRSADDVYIVYTGGTTGLPKGVMWRHEDLFFAALMGGNPYGPPPERPEQVGENAKLGPVLTALPAAPLMHAAAHWTALIYLFSGGTLVLAPGTGFDAGRIWQLVEQEKVQVMAIVGDAMARPLADALEKPGASYDTSSLLAIGSGGATYSEGVKAQLGKHLPNTLLLDAFGGSEGGNQGRGVEATEGQAGPRFQADETSAVLDENMKPLPPGTGKIGMLARKGRIPLGYYKDEEKTATAFIEADGTRWVIPGDMASIEADGTITLLGRGSNCINSGGEKIFPEEVEAALRSHPKVFDALVVGVPDLRFTERVAAVVAAREGQTLKLEELDAHCRTCFASYKVPRELHLVDQIQRQPSGKPDYRWAKAVALGETTGATGGASDPPQR